MMDLEDCTHGMSMTPTFLSQFIDFCQLNIENILKFAAPADQYGVIQADSGAAKRILTGLVHMYRNINIIDMEGRGTPSAALSMQK